MGIFGQGFELGRVNGSFLSQTEQLLMAARNARALEAARTVISMLETSHRLMLADGYGSVVAPKGIGIVLDWSSIRGALEYMGVWSEPTKDASGQTTGGELYDEPLPQEMIAQETEEMIFSRIALVGEDVLGISEYSNPAGERVLLAYKLEDRQIHSLYIRSLDSGNELT